jgi:cytochrome b561
MQYGALAMQRIVRGRAGRKHVNRLRAIAAGVPQIQQVASMAVQHSIYMMRLCVPINCLTSLLV